MNPKIEAIVQSVLTPPLMRGSDIRCWSPLETYRKTAVPEPMLSCEVGSFLKRRKYKVCNFFSFFLCLCAGLTHPPPIARRRWRETSEVERERAQT